MKVIWTFGLIGLITQSACRTDETGLKAYNALPSVNIQSHSDGAIVLEGQTETFYALASDNNHDASELLVAWVYGEDIVCDWAAPDSGGGSVCEISPSRTEGTVRVEVRDPENAGAMDEVSITVEESFAPEIEILSPEMNSEYATNDSIQFSANISDAEDDLSDLTVTWTSSIDGEIPLDTTIDSNGLMSDFAQLTPGEHVIRLEVLDTMGKTSSEEVQVQVSEVNQPPLCEISEPTDGDSGLAGADSTFRGIVSDPDDNLTNLIIEWISDKDGTLGSSIANTNGEVVFTTNQLSPNSHSITLRVIDPDGDACTTSILYSIGSPPSVQINAPVGGGIFNEGEPIYFEAFAQDGEDAPNTLQIDWTSDIDQMFATGTPNSSGINAINYAQLSPGFHNITVTATDSDGLYDSAITTLRINSAPTAPTVTLSPNPAGTMDNITLTATGSTDLDGDPITYSYDWRLNGVSSGQISTILSNSFTTKGDTWVARVTPNDGYIDGPYTDVNITILNTAPEVTSVTISPTSPSTQDTLTCTETTSDVDGDLVSVGFAWRINGNLASSTTNTLTGPFTTGDIVSCEVTPSDGTNIGTMQSNSVTISNSPPVITDIQFSTNTPATDDLLTATVMANDPNGDPLTYTFEWSVDDGTGAVLVQTTTHSSSSDGLDGLTHFDRDDTISLVVTVHDGSVSTSLTTSTLTVINTAPTVFNPIISPVAPVAGVDDLECIVQNSDIDGDPITLTYNWNVNGSLTPFQSNVILSSEIADGEIWECVVTCEDGTNSGNTVSVTTTVGANLADATGGSLCGSAGTITNSQHSITGCLGDTTLSVGESSNSTYTLQSGTHYIYTPE